MVWGKTVVAEKPRITFLFVNKLDRLFGTPGGLVVLFRDAVFDVICRWSAVELLPGGAFVVEPLCVGILWPIWLRMVRPVKGTIAVVDSRLDDAISTGGEM